MRIGLAHHLGWAIAVVSGSDYGVVDRRRIELVGPDLPQAPVHHEGGAHSLHQTGPALDDAALMAELCSADPARAKAIGGPAGQTQPDRP